MWVSWSLSDIYCLFPFFIPFRFFLLYCLFTPIDFYKQSCSIKLEMESYNLYIYCNFFHLSFSILWKGKEKRKPKRKRKQKRKLWNFWENKVEAEVEAVPKIWKRKRKRFWKIKLKWKRKRGFHSTAFWYINAFLQVKEKHDLKFGASATDHRQSTSKDFLRFTSILKSWNNRRHRFRYVRTVFHPSETTVNIVLLVRT